MSDGRQEREQQEQRRRQEQQEDRRKYLDDRLNRDLTDPWQPERPDSREFAAVEAFKLSFGLSGESKSYFSCNHNDDFMYHFGVC